MSAIERGKPEILTLRGILRNFPPVYPSQKMLGRIGKQFGQSEVTVGPEAQVLLAELKQGEPLNSKDKARLFHFLASGSGGPSTHASAIYSRLSSEKAARRTKKGLRSS